MKVPPSVAEYLPDWPSGPFDAYREKATFDWKEMKLLIYGEKSIKYAGEKLKILEKDPLFQRNPWDEMTRDEYRRVTGLRMKRFTEYKMLVEDEFIKNPDQAAALYHLMGQFDWSLYIKKAMAQDFFTFFARMSGSKDHQKFVRDVYDLKAYGALLITELGHGSDTKSLKTTATFDPETQQFVFNTPSVEATKVWAGNLGQLATHAVVFAQLCTSDGQSHGLHQFLMPLRDPKTLLPYPNVTIGDMGPKAGLNGLDNGFLQFNNYHVDKSCLLSRNVKMTPEGQYTSKIKDKSKRLGVALGSLSLGRIGVIVQSYLNLQTAMTIAVRYSAVRKQFGPSDDQEWPVLEYQTQQWRLIPYIAGWYVMKVFHITLNEQFYNFFASVAFGEPSPALSEMGSEIHALTCAGKAVSSWMARDGIQEGRECCGGHGYLKASRFGELRDDHDPNNTYEGDNNVLLQSTANYLVKLYEEKLNEGKPIQTQLNICDYLDQMEVILETPFQPSPDDINGVISVYHYIICHLLKVSYQKLTQLREKTGDTFVAKNESQVYFLRPLSVIFFESNAIERFHAFIESEAPSLSPPLVRVLQDMELLYALWSLDKHMVVLYQTGFHETSFTPTKVRETILILCDRLKNNALSLVDVFAPPDFILNSSLGYSDGRVYDHIFEAFSKNTGARDRPAWYQEFTESVHMKPKL